MEVCVSKTKRRGSPIAFVGMHEVAILGDQRIIIPTGVRRQLKGHNGEPVFLGGLPGFKALVLCPQDLWPCWVRKAKRTFPCLRSLSGATAFLNPWQLLCWDAKGRVTLPCCARCHADIRANERAIVLGTDNCFQLWNGTAFESIMRQCQTPI